MDRSILVALMFAIISINSPLLTILSNDKDTHRQIRLVPDSHLILRQYFHLLWGYFLVGNVLMYMMLMTFSYLQFDIKWCVFLLVFSFIEALYSVWLEYCHPIKQDTREKVWKHPRKYLLLVLVYLSIFVFYSL